ncbi:unnamed protein product [Effrenium voratum]|nr:unnamed protein product [Effrenium voratum]
MAPLADHTVRSLNQLARQGRPEKVIAAVESLASKRLRPAVYHLNAVLNACRADWPRALSHMQHMCQEAVGVNKFSFTAALSAAAWQLAAALLRDMPRQVAPDTICYNAAMSTCHGEWAVALQWLQDMHSLLIERDFISFNAAITACISGGHWHIACALLADMQELLVEPLPSNVNAAISACASGRRWDVALRLLQGMAAAQLRADVMSFTAALGSCADPGLWASASGLLALMQSQEVAADIVSSNAAANVCAQGAQWQHAADILEDALKQSIEADGGLVSAVLSSSRADVENPQSWLFALALISRLEARGLGPRVQSRGSTLANCLRCGAWAHALHDQSSGMDMVCQTLAINAWHGARHWRHGLDLLRGLPLRRFAPDGPALNAGFAARDRRGAWTSAPQLLAQMRRQKLEVVTYSALGVLAQDGHWRKALALAGRDYTVIMACKEEKVLTMLADVEHKLVEDGKAAEAAHEKYSKFCLHGLRDLEYDIKDGKNTVEQLTANIEKASSEIEVSVSKLEQLQGQVLKAEADLKAAQELRAKDQKAHLTAKSELSDASDMLGRALKTLSQKVTPSMLQKEVHSEGLLEALGAVVDAAAFPSQERSSRCWRLWKAPPRTPRIRRAKTSSRFWRT